MNDAHFAINTLNTIDGDENLSHGQFDVRHEKKSSMFIVCAHVFHEFQMQCNNNIYHNVRLVICLISFLYVVGINVSAQICCRLVATRAPTVSLRV